MKAPDKIYIHKKDNPLEITWSEIKEKDCQNVEYIRKDLLLEWLNAKVIDYGHTAPFRNAIQAVINKLNSL